MHHTMQPLTVVLLLAVVSISVARQSVHYARILANFQCKGVPVSAPVEFMQANDNEAEHEHLVTINSKDGKFDATAHASKKRHLGDILTFQTLKPDFFLRIHYNCGCGEHLNTDFLPRNQAYLSEAEAIAKPFDYGIVELSKCI
uniref:Uncharacterized protein n=1 Tax=Panagrellus redivivus TaxID=6233 RepID=A0A7E4VDY4_PANRE